MNDAGSTPYLIDVATFNKETELLGCIEVLKQCHFYVKRLYYLTSADQPCTRGAHAHKALQQCMICLQGQVDMVFKGASGEHRFRLNPSDKAVVVPAGYWRDLELAPHTIVAVLASDPFDEADYIRDYSVFQDWLQAKTLVNHVPYLPLTRGHAQLKTQLQCDFDHALQANQWICGDAVDQFEREFSNYCGVDYAIGCGNGLDALTLILTALGISQDDEVIVPANSFIATALAVERVGARSVFVDCVPGSYGLDIAAMTQAITPNTKAIIPVHLYGIPVDMDTIMALAENHQLWVIEDAAQAHGAFYKGRRTGSLGHAAAFSFYPTKNLGALGDGGMVTTQDAALANTIRTLSCYGSQNKYEHLTKGVNSRLDSIQAAFLSTKLQHLDSWNERRREFAARYFDQCADLAALTLPTPPQDTRPVWHVFPILTPKKQRDRVLAHLTQAGIGYNIHYPSPIHRTPAYDHPIHLPLCEDISERLVSLPLSPDHSVQEIDYVCKQLHVIDKLLTQEGVHEYTQ